MNRIDNSGTGIAALGRDEDKYMAHVASGEMIVPPVITPETRVRLLEEMQNAGLDPSRYTVGDNMSINPITGLPEFGFSLKKAWKSVKKVVKKIAPIAAVIPGPWQSFAIVYNKANAINNIAKGDGGLGDILTLGAGGSQKLFGDSGAIKNITSGGFKTAGGGITNAFKNIGQVAKLDNLGNVIEGETVFNPFQYSKELGKTYLDDQKQGYGGFFSDVGGADTIGGQAFNTVTNTGNPMNAVFTPGMEGQMLQTSGQPSAGGQPSAEDKQAWLTSNFDLGTEKIVNGQSVIQHKDGNFYTPEQALQMYNQTINQTASSGGTPDWIKAIGDKFGFGGRSGLRDAYGGDGKTPGFIKGIEDTIKGQTDPNSNSLFAGGGMGGLGSLGLAGFLGKMAYDSAKKKEGGISETPKITMDQLGRYQLASDLGTGGTRSEFGLAPAPVKLTVANGGPIDNRMYYAEGGIAELDMREGGESEGPGTGTSDDIPAMLSDGEFVMTAAATKGAGSFNVNKTKSGIELISGGKSSRDKGVENMRELMNIFEAV